jgi:hypothetical protein
MRKEERGEARHRPEESSRRRERFRERGIKIRWEPKYQTAQLAVEVTTQGMDAQRFEPKFTKK